MFFKKRYLRSPRSNGKFFFLFNLFFCFNNFFFEFLGSFGFTKIYLRSFSNKSNNFLSLLNISYYKKNFNTGYIYSCIFNIINGLIFKYEKKIYLFGLGYKAILRSNHIHFYLSYSHPIVYNIPKDISLEIHSNEIIVKGINKQRVGEICKYLKNFKKPDPYKGKGIRYLNEKIYLKLIKKK